MTQEQAYIIELSRAAILDREPAIPAANLNWEYIWKKAAEQNISGLLASVILMLPKEKQPQNVRQWRTVSAKTTYLMESKNAEFQRMAAILAKNNIQPVYLKGCMARELYKNPALRIMGDFDLFIEERERDSVWRIFEEEGYEVTPNYYRDEMFMIKAKKGMMLWEIFTSLLEEFKTDTSYWNLRMRECTRRDENGCLRLDQTYDFAYTVLHASKHFLNRGCGIRALLDMMLMLKKYDSIDFEAVAELCGSQGVSKILSHVYNAAEKTFEIPVNTDYDQTDTEAFLEYMLQYGVFGHYKSYVGRVLDKDNTGGTLKMILFPGIKIMARENSYVRKFPFLLPIAWLQRFIRVIRRTRLSEIFRIIKATPEVLREKEYWANRLGLSDTGSGHEKSHKKRAD